MKKTYVFLFVAILLTGCQKSTSSDQVEAPTASEEDELYQKVMAIHDEVMPKMNDLYKIKKQLEKKIQESPDMVLEKREAIENQIKQVNEASESMMQWMRNFNPEGVKENKEEYMEYLNGEFEKVTKVKEVMLKALEENEK